MVIPSVSDLVCSESYCTSGELSVYSERCDNAYMVYIEHIIHYTVYSIQYIVYAYTMSNIKCTMHTKHWTLFIAK